MIALTIYSINHALGWASSGVEYAQLYRAESLRKINQKRKFIYTEFFNDVNFQHFAENIGFENDEVVWLYQALTDIPTQATTFSLEDLETTFTYTIEKKNIDKEKICYYFSGVDQFVTAYLCKDNKVFCAEYVSRGYLVRKDYYTDRKYFSEYFAPKNGYAEKYARHFYNLDGSIAYEEIIQGERSIFRIKNKILNNRSELLGYYLDTLQLTEQDIVLIDRADKIGSTILKHARSAKIGCVVHAEHYSENATDQDHILWNNFYEYLFTHHQLVDFYIASTEMQAQIMREQFRKYYQLCPKIYAIPVGNLAKLSYPNSKRQSFSLITASRLAAEKNINQLILAVVEAKKILPQLTFDIYGRGGKEEELIELINQKQAQDYIHLKGHHQLAEIYKNYEVYLSASGSEGFGLTLMEAVGSGLGMIGYNVPYGNPTFIKNGKNGYLINRKNKFEEDIHEIALSIVKLYRSEDVLDAVHATSYTIAKNYLIDEVAKKWQALIEEESAR